MSATQEYIGTLAVVECASCHMDFGVTERFHGSRRADHATFYCPLGHENFYPQKSEVEELREKVETAEFQAKIARSSRDAAWDQAQAAPRSARAYKGHLTRMRNRIANGVCPVAGCRRHFDNVEAHIRGQHPQWAAEHAEALS